MSPQLRRFAFALLVMVLPAWAQAAEVRLAHHPDYHEGRIVFSYLGDLWVVREDGSNPQRLTVHGSRDVFPRFSPDGQWIAFSSDRYGNYDVYVMPAAGGTPKRLTYHSSPDTVVGWSPDSKRVVFSSPRGRVFPGIPSLYEISLEGGLEQPLPADWGYWGSYSADGKRFAYNRHPMVWSRKHYRGSYCADLWTLDFDTKESKRILDNDLPDEKKPSNFWPMFSKNEIFFVSDRDVMVKAGSPEVMKSVNNIWKVSPYGGQPVQVTRHTSGSLFFPSLSSDGRVIVYEENFGLWKLDVESGKTTEVKIDVVSDEKDNNLETLTINGEADSYHLSPSGKRAVISAHGELFTIATDRGDVRRLTQSAGARDTQPQWSPDAKLIAFVSDRDGRDEVWVCDERGEGMKRVSDNDSQKGQLGWSPDSKALLYTGSDKKLYKYGFEANKTVVLAAGDVIGFGGGAIQNPQWSPDGKWVSYTKAEATLLPHVYIVAADGGKEQRVTDTDAYSDSNAVWTPDGKKLVYLTGGDIGNIGQAGRSTAQLSVVSLLPEQKDPLDRNIDSEEDAVAAEKQRPRFPRPRAEGEGDDPGAEARPPAKVEVKIDFNRIGRRARLLTRTADTIGSLVISPDSKTVAFVTSGTEGGRPVTSVWTVGLDGDRLTRVSQAAMPAEEEGAPPRQFGLGGITSLQFTKDGRTLYYRQGNNLYALAISPATGREDSATASTTPTAAPTGGRRGAAPSGDTSTPTGTARRINFTVKVDIDRKVERRQVFNESWRVMKHRFYDAAMHGVDWNKMKGVYEPLLDHVADQEELHNVVSMMIGELNASHTGISGGGRSSRADADQPQTRYPGFELEADPSGYYRVSHVYKNGPADKDYVKIDLGNFVLAVNDQELKAGDNYWKTYMAAPGTKLEFTVNSKPQKDGAWKTKITPVTGFAYTNLQYEKWVADRRSLTERLSNGEVGYLHIRQMNEASLRQFERDLAVLHNKKALVIDQRFNPGGGIDQELLQILQQRQYQYTRVRDSVQVTRPLRGFFGPMVVMANERSTSDAEVFPDGFRTLKLGKVVGVTTYGAVIGTGAYQLMDGSSIRTPGSGLWNVSGTNLENYGVPPDEYVDNTPADFLRSRDAQLEKAVEVVKGQMKK